MRLFFAVDLPAPLKDNLGSYQRQLRSNHDGIRWSDPAGYHVTLAFLGDLTPSVQQDLHRIGQSTASRCPAFQLQTMTLGGFPLHQAARILWLGLAESAALTHLAATLRACLSESSLPFDEKAFTPHLTLARCPHPVNIERWTKPAPVLDWPVTELVLFESRSSAGGVRYVPLETYPLTAPADPSSPSGTTS